MQKRCTAASCAPLLHINDQAETSIELGLALLDDSVLAESDAASDEDEAALFCRKLYWEDNVYFNALEDKVL